MDLGAYCKIEDLEQILEVCDIHPERLRGLRLMKEEKPVTDEKLKPISAISSEKTAPSAMVLRTFLTSE